MKRTLLLLALACCDGARAQDHSGHNMSAMPMGGTDAGMPPGYAPVHVDAERAAVIGLTTAAVEERDFVKTVRAVGVMALDETRTAHVHTKVRGWIDSLFVDFVGKSVRQGQPLLSIYSQEVYAAELEFLSIQDRQRTSVSGEFAAAENDAQARLMTAAKRRLTLWDVPQSEIDRLTTTREPRRTFPLLAPRNGTVVAKQALAGMFVDASLELYTLSDLEHLWALVDLYETDAAYVGVGTHAELTIEGVPASSHAMVAFTPPMIDPATRTLKVRFELDNSEHRLRPGAFVSAKLSLPMGHGLSVPESAVIRTGARAIVFVSHGDMLDPREVTLGPLVEDRYRVDTGLVAGDRVATGAQFLLDSESRLRASGGGGHAGH